MSIDKVHLELFYRNWESRLYNFAIRWVFDAAVAEELVQEAFLRVWKARAGVEEATLKSLLFKTLQNLAINHKRRQNLFASFDLRNLLFVGDSAESEQKLAMDQNLRKIQIEMEKLPLDSKKVLLLSFYAEMNYQEIAQLLNISEGTVASRKNRALKKLQRNLLLGGSHG